MSKAEHNIQEQNAGCGTNNISLDQAANQIPLQSGYNSYIPQGNCPHCGRCPCCGRNYNNYPNYPYWLCQYPSGALTVYGTGILGNTTYCN